jgi:hypothetical protein
MFYRREHVTDEKGLATSRTEPDIQKMIEMVINLLFEGQWNIKKICVKTVLNNLSSRQKLSRKRTSSDFATSLWKSLT